MQTQRPLEYMQTSSSIAQLPAPTPPQQGVYLSTEFLVIGVGGVVLSAGAALIKWFLGREISSMEASNNELTARIKELEGKQADDRMTAQTVNRLDERMIVIEDQRSNIKTLEQRFENMTVAFLDMQRNFQDSQKEHMTLRAELNREYVSRDDWLRTVAKLESMLEAVHHRLDRYSKDQQS